MVKKGNVVLLQRFPLDSSSAECLHVNVYMRHHKSPLFSIQLWIIVYLHTLTFPISSVGKTITSVFTKVANTLQDIRSDRVWKFVWLTKILSARKTVPGLEKSSRTAGVCVLGGEGGGL